MVSGQQLEYSIHPTPAILTLVGVWIMMDIMMDAIKRPKLAKTMLKYTILIRITLFQISDKGENGLGGVDAVLY